ncbi:UvrD-helicase domain-containing protein [Candidatus Peregrinibacteria bacterium]|nr:UvrD-helicase domain-containing protein [Candidatus Peregrinibacteria bacterium]
MSDLSPILADLNPSQREAVLTTEGPVLVVAGAGSGKTRALTHRIAYLIKERGVKPYNILAVTFTNKAAGEMRDRILMLLGKQRTDFDLPTIGTFHSLCVRILRKHIHLLDFENRFVIYDENDQLILMKHVLKDLKIDEKALNPRAVLNHISNAKNQLVGPADFEKMADSFFAQKVAKIYKPYQDALKKNAALDFDDLLMKTVELLRLHESVLNYYQERFRYIHVDEYQDTNHAQYVLTNLLAAKYKNICAIGDHDQAIYSWRGATIQNILDFEKDYPKVKIIKMEQNYRSFKKILDAANSVISRNRKRKEKALWTDRGEGDRIKLFVAENERHESEFIAVEIKNAVKKHEMPDYRDFVVLYRTNAQSRAIEETFMRYGIPYKIIGGIKFYARKEIKDVIAYLRVIANPSDSVSLMRIINSPPRQIGPKTLEKLQMLANIKDCPFFEAMRRADELGEELPDAKLKQIKNFTHAIQRLQKLNLETRAAGLVKYVLDETGYKKFLNDGTIEGEARLENVKELISVAAKYDKLEPGISLNIFLEEISLITDLDSLDEKDNAVTLMTLHSAKGLEFPWVFICGLEEGLLPHSRSIFNPEELEEERRLFYVGCTRAMDKLYLLHAKNRMLYGESQYVIPSQFLSDIPKELLETNESDDFRFSRKPKKLEKIGNKPIPFEKPHRIIAEFSDGDRVIHEFFGEGIAINVTGGIITVAFKNPKIGIKKLALAIAPLEKI